MQKASNTNLAVIDTKLTYIQKDVADIKESIESNYVTKSEFTPIARIVYGMVSVVLLAVVGAIVALVIK